MNSLICIQNDMQVVYYDVIEKKTKMPLMRLDFGMSGLRLNINMRKNK